MDLMHLPEPYNIQKYTNPEGIHVWTKPRNCKNVAIIAVGGAGGGAGPGATGTAGTFRRGGGGGGAGGAVSAYFPSIIAPQNFYIYIGKGGTGQTSNGDSGSPTRIKYSAAALADTNTEIIRAPAGNGALSGVNGGSGGNTQSVSVIPSIFRNFIIPYASYRGGGGNSSSTATRSNLITDYFLTGGAGGGYVDSSNIGGPGSQIGGMPPLNAEDLITSTADAEKGRDGYVYWVNEWLFTARGGSGGNGNTSGTGGSGGSGAIGCGGGGGAAGSSGQGRGGNGGDGIVIVITW